VDLKRGEAPSKARTGFFRDGPSNLKPGVSLDDITPQIARQLGLAANTLGAVITQVEPGSAAQEAGLQRGDVIQEINHKSIANATEVRPRGARRREDTLVVPHQPAWLPPVL
jgi:S1-C subfamily serine protease